MHAENKVTFVIEALPHNHPNQSPIFLASTKGSWQPDHKDYQFVVRDDGKYVVDVYFEKLHEVIEYKITRGSWETVELNEQAQHKENRRFVFDDKAKEYPISVSYWHDLTSPLPRKSTLTAAVDVIRKGLSFNHKERTVRVMLPPGYQQGDDSYPVLYMFDGQDLFDDVNATYGEWQLDERMYDYIEASGNKGFIIVGIDSPANCERSAEFSAWNWNRPECKDKNRLATRYANYLVNVVKTYVDKNYRTNPDRTSTYLGGSSLAGYMVFYTAIRHQETFGKIFALSNLVTDQNAGAELRYFIQKTRQQLPIQIYFDIGDNEIVAIDETTRKQFLWDSNVEFYRTLQQSGFPRSSITFKQIPGGTHGVNSWRRRILDVWLTLKL